MGTMFENFCMRRSDDEFVIYVKDRAVLEEAATRFFKKIYIQKRKNKF